jgi:hypothetical protein
MLSYLFYKTLHLTGVFLTLMSLGALAFYLLNGGEGRPGKKRFLAISHGVGLLLVILGGFGMIARLNIEWPWPGWIFAKLAIWLALGAMAGILPRRARQAGALWWVCVALGVAAAYLALYKPF